MDGNIIKIADELKRIERRVDIGGYDSREFWRLVSKIKADDEARLKLAEWVGRIDRKIFEKRTRIRIGVRTGNLIAGVCSVFGFLLIFFSKGAAGEAAGGVYIVMAAIVLSAALHPLAHYFAGRRAGIKFLFYFPDGPARIEPSIKADYGSYLRADPLGRVAMHSAGPAATVLAAFLCLTVGFYIGAAYWARLALMSYLLIILGTEMFMSTRSGDLKRAIRERKLIKFKY